MPGSAAGPGRPPLYGEAMDRLDIRLPAMLLDRLRELASARGVSKAVIVRLAIERFQLEDDQGELELPERIPA